MHIPYPHQTDALELGLARNALFADACGLGKTLEAILVGKHYRLERPPNTWRFLVVCPKRLREQWVMALDEEDPDTPVYGIEGWSTFTATLPSGWYITHYEALTRNKYIALQTWDLVIADEAHRIMNRRTQRTKALKRISTGRKLALTGTPMEKNLDNLWSIFNWLYPRYYTSFWQFHQTYVLEEEDYWGYKKAIGPNPETFPQLAKEMSIFMLRRTKEEVAPDLPPRIMTKVPIRMEEDQQKDYDAIVKARDIVVRLPGANDPLIITNTLAQITRLQQIASLPSLLGSTTSSAKVAWVLDWLEDNPDIPVVIFSRFRDVALTLYDKIPKKCDLLIGGSERPEQFLTQGSPVHILVGTISMMGEGLNLQRADVAIFVDQEWSSIKMDQAFDRIHRLGIDHTKQIYMLACVNSVDELIQESLEKKWTEMEFVYEYIKRHMQTTE